MTRDVGRVVSLACGHQVWRLARQGRSLVGETLRCHECSGGALDCLVLAESPPVERPE